MTAVTVIGGGLFVQDQQMLLLVLRTHIFHQLVILKLRNAYMKRDYFSARRRGLFIELFSEVSVYGGFLVRILKFVLTKVNKVGLRVSTLHWIGYHHFGCFE